jgi:hypothetical protein
MGEHRSGKGSEWENARHPLGKNLKEEYEIAIYENTT